MTLLLVFAGVLVIVLLLFSGARGAARWAAADFIRDFCRCEPCGICGRPAAPRAFVYRCTLCREPLHVCDACRDSVGPENLLCPTHHDAREPARAGAGERSATVPVELVPAVAQERPIARLEISPEVYSRLQEALQSALADAKAISASLPFFLSAPKVALGRLDVSLAKLQGAVGSIEVVRVSPRICPICHEGYSEPSVAGLCPACAVDRGVTDQEPEAKTS